MDIPFNDIAVFHTSKSNVLQFIGYFKDKPTTPEKPLTDTYFRLIFDPGTVMVCSRLTSPIVTFKPDTVLAYDTPSWLPPDFALNTAQPVGRALILKTVQKFVEFLETNFNSKTPSPIRTLRNDIYRSIEDGKFNVTDLVEVFTPRVIDLIDQSYKTTIDTIWKACREVKLMLTVEALKITYEQYLYASTTETEYRSYSVREIKRFVEKLEKNVVDTYFDTDLLTPGSSTE